MWKIFYSFAKIVESFEKKFVKRFDMCDIGKTSF